MMRFAPATVVFANLLPALCAAEPLNPFMPDGRAAHPAAVFGPAPVSSHEPQVRIPPPVPEEDAEPLLEAVVAEMREAQTASRRSKQESCPIEVTPRAALVGAPGGEFIIRVKDQGGRECIAGIEIREPWLRIRYFNGHELALYAEPNTTSSVRQGELYLANAVNSLVLPIVQVVQ